MWNAPSLSPGPGGPVRPPGGGDVLGTRWGCAGPVHGVLVQWVLGTCWGCAGPVQGVPVQWVLGTCWGGAGPVGAADALGMRWGCVGPVWGAGPVSLARLHHTVETPQLPHLWRETSGRFQVIADSCGQVRERRKPALRVTFA